MFQRRNPTARFENGVAIQFIDHSWFHRSFGGPWDELQGWRRFQPGGQISSKGLAPPYNPRLHGADGNFQDIGDFFVAHVLDLPQDKSRTKDGTYRREGFFEQSASFPVHGEVKRRFTRIHKRLRARFRILERFL